MFHRRTLGCLVRRLRRLCLFHIALLRGSSGHFYSPLRQAQAGLRAFLLCAVPPKTLLSTTSVAGRWGEARPVLRPQQGDGPRVGPCATCAAASVMLRVCAPGWMPPVSCSSSSAAIGKECSCGRGTRRVGRRGEKVVADAERDAAELLFL